MSKGGGGVEGGVGGGVGEDRGGRGRGNPRGGGSWGGERYQVPKVGYSLKAGERHQKFSKMRHQAK